MEAVVNTDVVEATRVAGIANATTTVNGSTVAAGITMMFALRRDQQKISADDGCHDITDKDYGPCLSQIKRTRTQDKIPNIKRFSGGIGGLTLPKKSANLTEWQALVYKAVPWAHCPRPCSMKDGVLCKNVSAPPMWKPFVYAPSEKLDIKILSYNLYWWNLFGIHKDTYKGTHNSVGHLINDSMNPPYDVMGFQECENSSLVLKPVGLDTKYEIFQGDHFICMAYQKETWELLGHGQADVAEDQATEYYGLRGSQWMRLQHKTTGQTLFFVNHHGPLHVNSGGECGGVNLARTLLHLIANKGEEKDVVVLVGDFNANAVSITVQELWKHLVLVYNGDSFAGVDNVFTNLPKTAIVNTETLGSGGSDHHAISTTLSVGAGPFRSDDPDAGSKMMKRKSSEAEPLKAWKDAEIDADPKLYRSGRAGHCGMIEPSTQYNFSGEPSWTHHIDRITDPRACCARCATEVRCKAWMLFDWVESVKGQRCVLSSGEVAAKVSKGGVTSGLSPKEALVAAKEAMSEAISEID